MSNALKYIVIAVVLWLLYAYLSKPAASGYSDISSDCGSKGGCDDSAPVNTFSNEDASRGITMQHPSNIIR